MITRFRVQNYKALRDVTLDLTPIHVLIGPNDSGKTSILEAIAALSRSVDYSLAGSFIGSWEGASLVWQGNVALDVVFDVTFDVAERALQYYLASHFAPTGQDVKIVQEIMREGGHDYQVASKGQPVSYVQQQGRSIGEITEAPQAPARRVYESSRPVEYCRWNPRILCLPVAANAQRRYRIDSSGFGLALCLDDILGYDRQQFNTLEKRFTSFFPEFSSIALIRAHAFNAPLETPQQIPMLERREGKGIFFRLSNGGSDISAFQVSDGVLLVLAYLTILHLPQPPRVLLIEEPENSVHPKRLQDVLTILRELVQEQKHTQVILTTHSPYVVDLFKPDEVTLCRKQEDGSIAVRRLSESKTVREQMDYFTLGEIWTAEGDEALAQPASQEQDAAR